MKQAGIYMIRSKCKPERCYIGSTQNIEQRWNRHLQLLKEQRHHSKKLQYHVNKYGKEDLLFCVLITCDAIDLIKHEQFFIDSYNPYFNIAKIAGSCLGCKRSDEAKRMDSIRAKKRPPISEETRIKISIASKGRHQSEETRRKRSISLKGRTGVWNGRKHSEETKQKIRIKATGRKHTEDAKKRTGEASRLRNKGKRHSQETKNKLSAIHKGRKFSDETINKMREAGKRRIFTDELRRKLSLGHTGKKQSQETIQKRIRSVLLYHENKRKTA